MNSPNSPKAVNQNLLGMAWMMLGGAVFSVNFSVIRILSADFHVFEIVFFRNIFGFIVLIPFLMRAGRVELWPKRPVLLTGRAVMQVTGLSLWYFGLTAIPLADATALGLLEPIFAALFAIFFFKEKNSLGRWLVVVLGLVGSLIIVRPGLEEVSLGAVSVVVSAVIWAVYVLNGKVLTRTDSALVVVAYPTALVVPLALIPALFFWQTPSLIDYAWFILAGTLSSIANYALTKAYQVGDVTAVAPIGFTRLIFSAMVGYLVFAEIPVVWVWLGGGLIVVAGTILAHMESKDRA
ncbi:MAG: DMT family transporter [Rhodospirillaceae bacterium]|jgi:drug/metabolite transporter (DMT)-like permease|nr:DMT family transporter [Rhodospirillaceae bacterium]MBT4588339.1 DMT family transporter [Rhodospirillaceae bacterium]MBT4940183.1 DMT family transporter [Rhodospirillaceae bacterium]MBT7266044.1 DMT family transporter [Rhodospirillaceae bacterium]